MTEKYAKQLEIEKINKAIIENILATVKPNEFINFYLCHNQKETMANYGLRTIKQLIKVLKLFNYDFSTQKPSKFKGKTAARSHESYVAGGLKSSNTQKKNWSHKSDEELEAWSKKQAKAHSSDEFKRKIRQINIEYHAKMSAEEKADAAAKRSASNKATWKARGAEIIAKAADTCMTKYGKPNYAQTDEYRAIVNTDEIRREKVLKTNETKTKNGSWNCSKPEDAYFEWLKAKYGEDDIKRQYRDSRYPYNCDFYIKSQDLFIELNLTWSHGGHPYDGTDPIDIKKAAVWREKATTSEYYKNALFVWTVRDPEKLATAKANHLNYKIYYTEAELYE